MKIRSSALLAASLALVGCSSSAPPARAPEAALAPCDGPAAVSEAALVTGFYEGFARGNVHTMACAYHPQVEFHDPMFGTLKGKRAVAMWAMLVQLSEGKLRVQASQVRANPTTAMGSAHWNAQYTFKFLGRNNPVQNSVEAAFLFKDGKIWRHRDDFDLSRWMHQALWPLGGVVSKGTIRGAVKSKLDDFVKEHPAFR